MYKSIGMAAALLQVAHSVSLEHMQEIAKLQDIQSELPQYPTFFNNLFGRV